MNTNLYAFAKKIIRFYMVGGLSLLGNTFIVYVLADGYYLSLGYSYLAIFVFNMTIIYYLQKHITFGNKHKSTGKHLIKFGTLVIAIILCNYLLLPYLSDYFEFYRIGMLIISLGISIVNFIIQHFIFKHPVPYDG